MFYAHSTGQLNKSDWQLLSDHLKRVGEMAAQRAERFGAGEWGMAAGLLHDLGKYSFEFQMRLEGMPARVNHSTAGAKVALEKYGPLGQVLAYIIAGHHAGLANGREDGERSSLQGRLKADLPEIDSVWQKELELPERLEAPRHFKSHPDRAFFQYSFLTRMLFSCLVDADFIETETFYGEQSRGGRPSLELLKTELDNYLGALQKNAVGELNQLRTQILSHVRKQVGLDQGNFTLTVPTGGGKTLTSLAFAIDHALEHGMDRVIFVIPFTSIIEQNAAVFRKAFGQYGDAAVLEHHSAFDAEISLYGRIGRGTVDKLRRDSENWDAPVVVTTAVQFFESLFAAKTSRCRKLHNIANSVVVLDEAQTMPLHLLRPSVAALQELSLNYHASIVLCTATQPPLIKRANAEHSFSGGLCNVKELSPDPSHLYRQLKRVTVTHLGTIDDKALSRELLDSEQVLCIVNNRRHARSLFDSISAAPGAFHLTTAMCAVHRREVLEKIRSALNEGKPCRVVSTSLIEAGVDIDFPRVLRAETGLDSIAQAAGRCNREGRRDSSDSEVAVFAVANEDWAPPPELKQYAQVAREIMRHHEDPLSMDAITEYFQKLYWQMGQQQLDRRNLLSSIERGGLDGMPFEVVEQRFRMIENSQRAIIIPLRGDEVVHSAIQELSHVESAGGVARKLQGYTVQVPKQAFVELEKVGAVAALEPGKFGDQFMQLINMDLYSDYSGLNWDTPTFLSAESLVM